jgi:polyhydroxybutyrate depolymerase
MVFEQRRLPASLFVLGLLSCGFGGCSISSGGGSYTGGTTGSGGAVASGGSGGGSGGTTSTGGSSGTGGTVASGGSVASGGTKGSGGVQETGGTVGTGGNNSGGTKATGGTSSSGGAATGGSSTGGAATGGSATDGSAKDGSATDGPAKDGSADSPGAGSPGCGTASPLKTGNFTESISGTSRKWMLDVPTGYDTNKPYRLIFVWHPLSGSGSQIVSGGFNGLKSLANNTAVFATADGLNGTNGEASGTGYWNVNGGDMKLLQVMLDKINAGLCIDQERIFSTGFSFGGMMSYTVGFQFDVFRAVAPCSGKTGVIPYDDNNEDPLAIMAFHGDKDTFVTTALGKAFFDMYAKRNKCGTQTKAVDPSPCVQYQDCVVPTIWCAFPGQHEQWSQEPAAIWKFFSQF